MKQSFAENKSLALLLAVLAFVLLGAFYYFGIYPKTEQKAQMERSIEQIEAETRQLEDQVAVLSQTTTEDTDDFELRKKLPIHRDLDVLLHSIHEVELLSDSRIIRIDFNNYDEEVAQSTNLLPQDEEEEADSEEEVASADGEEEEESENTTQDGDEDDEKPVTPIAIDTLPAQLKLITLEVEMLTLDEETLMVFLKELESIERVIRIDAVEIQQPGEEELSKKDPDERISVAVQLTTFYSETD